MVTLVNWEQKPTEVMASDGGMLWSCGCIQSMHTISHRDGSELLLRPPAMLDGSPSLVTWLEGAMDPSVELQMRCCSKVERVSSIHPSHPARHTRTLPLPAVARHSHIDAHSALEPWIKDTVMVMASFHSQQDRGELALHGALPQT